MNKRISVFISVVFLLSIFCKPIFAQQSAERSKVIETIAGKKYYKHTVEKGQTLYSISKLYAIDQKIIEDENPEIKDGLKLGKTLIIPYDGLTAKPITENKTNNNYIKHIVEKEQTLYSISKKYNVAIEEIKKLNPDAENGIRLGQELTIPIIQTNVVTTPATTKSNTAATETDNKNQGIKSVDVKPSKEIVKQDGKEYYLHKVEPGQTIYSIAKAYNISRDELINQNPQLLDGSLQRDQILRIELLKNNTTTQNTITETDTYFLHKIEIGQTINAIAIKYGCTNEEIFAMNPDVVNGLKEGVFIKIPKKKAGSVSFVSSAVSPYTKKRSTPSTINVGLFLPFYLAKNDSGRVYKTTSNDETIFPKSIPAVEFYQGFLLALDSIKKTGLNLKLFVYDFPSEPATVTKFLEKQELKDLDLIVGPFHSDEVASAANFAKKNSIPLFAPFSQQSKALLGNPYLVKVTASTPTIIEQTAEFIALNYAKENIVIIHNALPKEKNAVDVFKTRLREKNITDSINEVVYKTTGVKGINSALKSDKKNILFFPSTDQAIVTDLINKLTTDKKNEVVLFGLDNWTNYENLDIDLTQKINLHLPALGNVNYSSDTVKNFIAKFRSINKNEPSRYAFTGYDTGILLSNLFANSKPAANYDQFILQELPLIKKEGLLIRFSFYQTSMDSGMENQGVYILKYQDYTLKNAN